MKRMAGPTTGSTVMLWYTACSAMVTPLGRDESKPLKGEGHRIDAGPEHH